MDGVRGGTRPLRSGSPRLRATEPIEVVATRGGVIEARHRVHAVAVSGDARVLEAGDPALVAFFRSSAKPIQALPLVRARPDLADAEIAIACASHLAQPDQIAAVRSLLAKAPADESDLETGPEPTPLEHNCSGKHAGFLALCRARGWATEGYRLPDHPCQREMLSEVAALAELDPSSIRTAVDGCGVVTFALALATMARAFSRLPRCDGGERVIGAMRAYPDLIRGPLAADSILMRELPGWAAKGGAEGLICATGQAGLGVALKVEDGNTRAVGAALGEVLQRLGFPEVDALARTPVATSRGEIVGEIALAG
jgi:L-asparaginase II